MGKEDRLSIKPGKPGPLGLSTTKEGVNIALFSPSSESVSIGIFQGEKLLEKIPLSSSKNKTEGIWHLEISPKKDFLYAFSINGQWVADPYAKQLYRSAKWGSKVSIPLAYLSLPPPFNWEGDHPLNLPFEKLSIYEMHVRGFTKDPSSQVAHPGTFLAVIEKIPHLKNLGITAVELLPIFAFDETANTKKNPITGDLLYDYWGYSTQHFFAPMAPYGTINEFKTLVKALHKAGVEVILDVVFNHVGDNGWELLDKKSYFILDELGNHTNYTGCGNTVNCNHPIVIDLILSCLRYWVEEMHVDGFRFDLASIFCRGHNGEVMENPPLIDAIVSEPRLADTKLIAEAWDCAGLYQVGTFPGNGRFAEWNGRFRDSCRRFLKGESGQVGAFANALTGSTDLYGNYDEPYRSINFITSHDGFTLQDLVSYNEKHNEDNAEGNRDGTDVNESWNCGAEGPTNDPDVLSLREQQKKNFLLALGLSTGTPMFLMGDEYGHSRNGNNNAYAQDNKKNYFLWNLPKDPFLKKVLSIRNTHSLFQRKTFLTKDNITWHGHQPNQPNWDASSRFVAYALHDTTTTFYIAFNTHFDAVDITLPSLTEKKKWKRLIDTSLTNADEDILNTHYYLPSYSALLLIVE